MALYLPRKDGSRLIDHCEAVAAQKGDWPEEFPLPEVPDYLAEVWEWFWELRESTGGGFGGPEPIAFAEMAAWNSLLIRNVKPIEVRLIRIMDAQYRNSVHELTKKK